MSSAVHHVILAVALATPMGAGGERGEGLGVASGYAIESAQLGASVAQMNGTLQPELRLHGIAGQVGDATLQGGAVWLEGGFLHRLELPDAVFGDGFEGGVP